VEESLDVKARKQAALIEENLIAEEAYKPEPVLTGVPLDGLIRVGFLAPISGRHKALGEALLNAAQLALFDLSDDRFKLIVGDTGGTPEGARAAARDLMDQGATLLIGPVFADSVREVGEETRFRNVSVIGFSNDLSAASSDLYVMGLAPETQVHRIVSFAASRELYRIAALVPEDEFGGRVVAALQEASLEQGVELAGIGFYDPEAEDLTAEVIRVADYDRRHKELLEEREKLEAEGGEAAEAMLERMENLDTLSPPEFDALLLPMGGRDLLTLASLFAFYDVDPVDIQYLGTAQWEDPSLTREPTLQDGWFPAPPPQLWEAFSNRYEEAFGRTPPRVASLGYDATALAAVLARSADAALAYGVFSRERLRILDGCH
jgi:ABC-type branched-subunit amino acid transport system substrate-binding protein